MGKGYKLSSNKSENMSPIKVKDIFLMRNKL